MKTCKDIAWLFSFSLFLSLAYRSQSLPDSCVYDLNPKGIIDLTSIGRVDGTPAWKNIPPEKLDAHVYSYNPCRPFTQSSCKDVASCQTFATDEKLAYSLGTQNSLQWKVVAGQDLPNLFYTSGERSLLVNLRCLDSGGPNKLDVHGHDSVTNYFTMTLSSKCACWDRCKGGSGSGSSSKLGGGTIFILFLGGLIIVYVIIFAGINRFRRQATGADILPHRTFWVAVPGHALYGVTFLFRKATGKETNYTPIP